MKSNMYECSVAPTNVKLQKTLMTICKIFKWINIALALITFIIAFIINISAGILTIFFTISAILFIFGGRIFYCFYDYSFVDGELRIIKVVNNTFRRKVAFVETKEIQSVGKVFGATYNANIKNKFVKKLYGTSNKIYEKDLCILYKNGTENFMLVIEYNQEILSYLVKYTGVRILDKDLVEFLKTNSKEAL